MNLLHHLNTAIGSSMIIILIAADYLRKHNTDGFQRRLVIIMLGAIFIAAISDFLGTNLYRKNGTITSAALYYIWSIYMIARNCCYYYGAAFIDYFAHGNSIRTKKIFRIITVLMILYVFSIIGNFQLGYYFYISKENAYTPGTLFMLQVFLSYFPLIIIMIDVSLAPKYIKHNQVILTIFFVLITAVGAALDIILRTTNLIWPCITAAMLYIYFFIIRSAAKIDSLTGMENRNSFNEYINKLSKQSAMKDYAFIMIDLNCLREINDTLGHLEGDNALRDISAIIKGCVRHTDYAARFNNDEFILVTPAENDIKRIIDRINDMIDTQNKKNIRPYKLFISCVYDVHKSDSVWSIQDFLAYIEDKMYKYKEERRGRLSSVIAADPNKKSTDDGENNV